MEIKKYVSRYVVPFYYDYEKDGYRSICNYFEETSEKEVEIKENLGLPADGKWRVAGFWEKYKSNNEKQSEMELYTYLFPIFKENTIDQREDLTSLGNSYVYCTGGKLFGCRTTKKEKISFACRDLGVLLLKNGIGFLWYEIDFGGRNISVEEYINFQNEFKELARTQSTKIEQKIGYDKEKEEGIYEPFCLGKWFADFLNTKENGIRFWSERSISADTENKKEMIPDKALLFQYLCVDNASETDCDHLAFRAANGYDMKYNAPSDITSHTYKPFGNTSFYISKAGMACVASNTDSNEIFFAEQFSEKFIRDYFFLYLLLCYQSYSCVHYSRLLTKLPANEKFFEKDSAFMDRLESINSEINLFLVKSVFDSVSNVHHQNEVYRYGKEVLRIHDDIQSLTIGLEALEEIEKNKHERKVNNAIAYFGLLVVISTVFDGFSLVDWLVDMVCKEQVWVRIVGYCGICILIGVLAIHLLRVLMNNKRRNK